MTMIIQFSLYIIEGSIILLVNGLLVCSLLRKASLRSKYAIIVPRFITDTIVGLAALVAGTTTLRSRIFCMFMPWNLLFVWSDPMSAVVQLAISLDRLISLIAPIFYYKRPVAIQMTQTSLWHVSWATVAIAGWTITLVTGTGKTTLDPICWFGKSVIHELTDTILYTRIIGSISAVVLYVIVFIVSRRHMKRMSGLLSSDERALKKGRQLTQSMLISCIATFSLYVVPIVVEVIWGDSENQLIADAVAIYSQLSTGLNPLVHATIVISRHADIAESMLQVAIL
ncbi:hypothetical protein PRIPAC_75282 [Pristionchus pacificus]|uniref:G protein-coupled receptor n=1 Tax=Pristionchus pacificus TaxID=54126 RepID=A0A2A6B508_PRIPA|nr:hypothetical protein PRIPAC_75282 [Pristionchus pacificus]|eukprot:PDM60975.1 G protein-coupled receptor [Pristionchus pacificus]